MTSLATTPRPAILSYMAPAVRLELLGDSLVAGPERGEPVDASIAADISKVEIKQEHTDVSQYTVVLSNWRTAPDPRTTNGAARSSSTTLAWPRYKYNDFQTFAFGKRLRISLRYWPDQHRSQSEATQRAHRWVPMIAGPITDMRFTFGEKCELTITGEDDLSRLKDKHRSRVEFCNPPRSELDIVREVLTLANFPLRRPQDPRTAFPAWASQPGQGVAEGLQDGQSYLDYLKKLAERLDAELFIAFADLDADIPEQRFYFEPARSRIPFDDPDSETLTIERDSTLVTFTPTLQVVQQPTSVEVRGRHRDRERPDRVSESSTAADTLLADELQYDAALESQPSAGPTLRDHFFPGRTNPLIIANQTNTDPQRARFMADTKLRQEARKFLTIQASTVGLPRLRPGNYTEIRGLREPFDGFYYVTQATHTFDKQGLRTTFAARRPGMPRPQDSST